MSQEGPSPLPEPTSSCPGAGIKPARRHLVFHGSWSLSLAWDPTTSQPSWVPSCRWRILRLPMVQQAGLLLPSNPCAIGFSSVGPVLTPGCRDPPHLASRGMWQPFAPSFPKHGYVHGEQGIEKAVQALCVSADTAKCCWREGLRGHPVTTRLPGILLGCHLRTCCLESCSQHLLEGHGTVGDFSPHESLFPFFL